MMQRHLLILLLLLPFFSVNAEIYKGVDTEGNVTFSDKETPNAEIIPMPSPNTVNMPKAARKTTEEKSEITSYSSLKIVQPTTNLTLRDNTGKIAVTIELVPDLDVAAGHSIAVYLDGKPAIKGITTLTTQLSDVPRGSHGVKVHVKDENGKSLIASKKVIVHMKRLSELHPAPVGPSIGPVDSQGKPIPPTRNKPGPVNPNGTPIKPGPQNSTYKPGPQ